jgi:hypothetical protein
MGEPILGQEESRMGIFNLIRSLLFLPINLITMPFRMWVNSMMTMIGCGLAVVAVVVVVVLVVIFVVLG